MPWMLRSRALSSTVSADGRAPLRSYAPLYRQQRSGRGLVAHPVFKTGRAEQPSAWMVRFHRRSVGRNAWTDATLVARLRSSGFSRPSAKNGDIALCGDSCRSQGDRAGRRGAIRGGPLSWGSRGSLSHIDRPRLLSSISGLSARSITPSTSFLDRATPGAPPLPRSSSRALAGRPRSTRGGSATARAGAPSSPTGRDSRGGPHPRDATAHLRRPLGGLARLLIRAERRPG